jgi:hypothetical protein
MVGATRSRASKAAVKEAASPSDDGTIAEVPLDQSSNFTGRRTTLTTPQGSENSYVRDAASRLSEGLEPMHLGDYDGKYYIDKHSQCLTTY